MDEKLDLILKRLQAAEDERKWMRPTIVVALIGALVSAFGVFADGFDNFRNRERESQRLSLEIQKTQQAFIQQLTGGYHQRLIGIKTIAAINPDIDVAIGIEKIFRSGGTIRGLEEYRNSLCSDGCDAGDVDQVKQQKIDAALSDVRGILFIDSTSRQNAYCENTRENSGTNLEDVLQLVRDLPFHIGGVYGDIDQNIVPTNGELPHPIVSGIYDKKPELVVIHLGAFDAVRYADEQVSENNTRIDQIKIRTFLNELSAKDNNNDLEGLRQIIIYSRSGSSLFALKQPCAGAIDSSCIDPSMDALITLVDFEGGGSTSSSIGNNEGCFYVDGDPRKLSDNGRRMRRAIYRHLDPTRL